MPDFPRTALNDCALAFDQDDQKFLFISPDVCNVLGYNVADFYQNTGLLYNMIDPHYRDNIKEEVAKLFDGDWTELYYKVITADGKTKWIYDKKSLITDKNSGHKILLSIIKDHAPGNTGYQSAVNLKTNAAENLNIFIESIADSFFIVNNKWEFVKVNIAFEKIFRKRRDEVLGKVIWEIFPVILTAGFREAYLKAAAEKVRIQFTEYFKPLNMWFNTTVYPSTEGLTVFVKDITDEKHVHEELIGTKNSLEALINNTEDQIWSVDTENRYVYMNKAYRSYITGLSGIEPKEGDCLYLHKDYSPGAMKKWKQYYSRAFKGEVYSIVNESFDPVTQQALSFEISFNPIFKSSNEVTAVGCYARNITERLKIQKTIIDQNEQLRQIASLTSHELRRPVASMIGLINIMDRTNFFNPDNQEIIEHLFTVGSEIDEVIRLIIDKTFTDYSTRYLSPSP